MSGRFLVTKVYEFCYTDEVGDTETIVVPEDLNQSLLRNAKFGEYTVTMMGVDRPVAESEVSTLKSEGRVVGFLIPCQALLSSNHPCNENKLFGTYSIIAAMRAFNCLNERNYPFNPPLPLPNKDALSSTGFFYCILWRQAASQSNFIDDHFVSLSRIGVYPTPDLIHPTKNSRTLSNYATSINLTKNTAWPDYVSMIITKLSPFASDPYLKFFYLYQVIETLMAHEYANKQTAIRVRFDANPHPSISDLKDFLNDFKAIVNETPRINSALDPGDPGCTQSAEKILTSLGIDFTRLSFGEKVYKIRNTIFHDYKKIHHIPNLIAEFEDNLMNYLLEKKLA